MLSHPSLRSLGMSSKLIMPPIHSATSAQDVKVELGNLKSGIESGDHGALARAITLLEGNLPIQRAAASELLSAVCDVGTSTLRIGVSGVPGAGKSTLINSLGMRAIADGKRVAVLAVDPSSTTTGGSILGDKTRMVDLASQPGAFIRPSPTRGVLGGVTDCTYEAILLCEAAGFDLVIVESVGVGQSEVALSDLVDVFMLLLIAGGGDELQGIKRGVMERADMLVMTKADGRNIEAAKKDAARFERELALLQHRSVPTWAVSTQSGLGIAELWDVLSTYKPDGQQRAAQHHAWYQRLKRRWLMAEFDAFERTDHRKPESVADVLEAATDAVRAFLSAQYDKEMP